MNKSFRLKRGVIAKAFGIFLLLALTGSLFILGGCSSKENSGSGNRPAQKTPELKLYVAAGLKKPMDAVIEKFQQEKGVKVIPNYGSSGELWTQIKEGQPCDLYYAADWLYIKKARDNGKLVKGEKFLKDNIALVVSPAEQGKIHSLQDLTKPGVTFVIADKSAPAGVYAENALKNMGLWEKATENLKARPATVNQVAIMVKENQVDAGLIFSSVARAYNLKPVQEIGNNVTGEIIFAAAIIKGGNEVLAKQFMEYATRHMDEFTKYGWKPYA